VLSNKDKNEIEGIIKKNTNCDGSHEQQSCWMTIWLTYATETRSRNLYQQLVHVVLYKKLARVLVNLLQVFFWYKLLTRNSAQFYSSKETVWHVTQTMQRDWPASFARLAVFVLISFRLFSWYIYLAFRKTRLCTILRHFTCARKRDQK